MSYITKYLDSLLKKKDSVHQALTTNSVYYTIGSTLISVSDHFSNTEDIDIRIVQPLNSRTVYLVQIKEGANILQFSLKELKEFIKNYLFINQIKFNSSQVSMEKTKISISKIPNENVETRESDTEVVTDVNDSKQLSENAFTSEGYSWNIVVDILKKKGLWRTFSSNKKKKLRTLLLRRSISEIETIMSDSKIKSMSHLGLEGYFKSKGW